MSDTPADVAAAMRALLPSETALATYPEKTVKFLESLCDVANGEEIIVEASILAQTADSCADGVGEAILAATYVEARLQRKEDWKWRLTAADCGDLGVLFDGKDDIQDNLFGRIERGYYRPRGAAEAEDADGPEAEEADTPQFTAVVRHRLEGGRALPVRHWNTSNALRHDFGA